MLRRSGRWWSGAILFGCGALLVGATARGQGCFLNAQVGPPQLGSLSKRAPDERLDNFLTFHLGAMSDRFRVRPRFYYFDDAQGPNAFFSPAIIGPPQDFPPDMNAQGTVIIGRRLIALEMFELPQNKPPYPILGILAHEFAHTVQAQQRFPYKGGPAPELHADFMSGWFMRYVKERHDPRLKESEVFSTFYNKGDTLFFDPQHHGTSLQRLDAFLAGFNLGDDRVDFAYNEGLRFVRTRLNLP